MKMLPALAGALALLCAPSNAEAQTYQQQSAQRQVLIGQLHQARRMTWYWQERLQRKHARTLHRERAAGLPLLRRLVGYWQERRHAAWRAFRAAAQRARLRGPSGYPPHYQAWLCIHRYEGAWNDPGGPYYGGLQFGFNEWQRFGAPYSGAGTADRASPLEQMWAAERYWQVSGFYPWPQTAHACGLI